MWKVVRISPFSAITWVASLLSGFSSSSKDGMSAKTHTDNMSMMTTVNGTVNKIQNHLIILFLVLSVINY